jgi:Na+-driven multidrug efflux pump
MPFLYSISQGIVRGCGRQKMGAYTNLAAYYLVGNPVAYFAAFVFFQIKCILKLLRLLPNQIYT